MNRRYINYIDILESPGTEPYKFDNATIIKKNIDSDFVFISDTK